jgi:hypothetical protein
MCVVHKLLGYNHCRGNSYKGLWILRDNVYDYVCVMHKLL